MLAVSCALALLLAYTDLLWRLDLVLYDWGLRLWSRPAPADVVIVAVDERSLDALGRWPWSRRLHARLLERLTESGARTIGVDLVLAEPDTADPGADVLLAEAMQRHGRVVLPVLLEQTSAVGQLLETLPLRDLAGAAAGLGHVDVELDADGIARTVYLKAGLGSPRWPTFGLAMLEVDGRHPISSLPGERNPRPDASSRYLWVRDHRMLVPFAGPGGHLRQVSYVDVLRGHYMPGAFQGSLVLVGATASGLGDMLPTPVSGQAQPLQNS